MSEQLATPTVPTYTEKWKCNSCETIHDDEDGAEECCKPQIERVLICAACEEEFDGYDVKGAAACHPDGTAVRRCLCGSEIDDDDERPSFFLGSIVMCEPCRERVINGTPLGDAVRETFQESHRAAY